MNRWKASLTHFLISLAVAATVFLVVHEAWYPGPLFEVAGGLELILVVIAVDITLGPLVTLIVFKPGKPGLKFDLAFIGVVQAAALAYGIYAIAESRPVFITFVKDRFELVRAVEMDDRDVAAGAPGFDHLPWFRYRYAGAKPPRDPKEQLRHMDLALQGRDIHHFPRLYVPYEAVAADAAKAAAPLERLRKLNPGDREQVDALVGGATPEDELGFLPMRAGKRDMSVVVSKPEGRIVALLPLRPWDY